MRLELFKIKFAHFREYGLKHQQAAYKIDQIQLPHLVHTNVFIH